MKALPNSNIPANAAERLLDQRGRCLPFLEKTYRMIDSSPADLAAWSDKGDSFIVFKPKEFSEDVIPLYFKHKNFSSFVRQLNFYGFRKTKVNGKGKKNSKNPDGSDKEWWEFRHERFLRGNKALMKTIKRKTNMQDGNMSNHAHHLSTTAATLGEVKSLRSDIVVLSSRVKETSERLKAVTKIVLSVLKNGHLSKAEEEEAKKYLQDMSMSKSMEDDIDFRSSLGSEFSEGEDFEDDYEAFSTEEISQGTNKRKASCLSMEEKPAKTKFLKPFVDTKANSGAPTETLISPRALKFDFNSSDFSLTSDIGLCDDDLDMDKLFDNGSPSNKSRVPQQWNGMTDSVNGPLLNIMDDLPDAFFDSWQTLPSPRHAALNQPTLA